MSEYAVLVPTGENSTLAFVCRINVQNKMTVKYIRVWMYSIENKTLV